MRATLALNGLTTSRLELEKSLLPYFKSAFFNFSSFKVSNKKKCKFLNLGPEMPFSDSILKKIFLYLKSAPSNLSNCKVRCKQKNLNLGLQMPDFVYFWAAILKMFLYLNLAQLNLSKCKISCETKRLEIWDQKYHIWVFKQNFEENYLHI